MIFRDTVREDISPFSTSVKGFVGLFHFEDSKDYF